MCCAEGPVPRASLRAVQELLALEAQPWRVRWQEDFQGIPQATRQAAAQLLATEVENITLTPTTSSALTLVAQTFPWTAGDEVVVPLAEFPSNYWPWQALERRGVTLRQVPLWQGQGAAMGSWSGRPPTAADDVEGRLLDALGPSTRILAVSWVRFQDGLRLDLPRLASACRERGVDLVVDGIQGCGTLVVPVEGLAAFACGGHKGLLAPQGQGFLWTSPNFRRRLAPAGSWLSVEDATDFARPSTDFERPWNADGRRFEQGVHSLLACAALTESLGLLLRADVSAITQQVQTLQLQLLDALSSMPRWAAECERLIALFAAGRLGPFLPLHHGQTDGSAGQALFDRLMAMAKRRGVYLSAREGYLRLAFHGWHGPQDVERLAEVLRQETP